jgi:hypothetical protein
MYRKICEKKFRGSPEATDFLNETGWHYVGKRGLVWKHHLYVGISIGIRGELTDSYRLHLYSDGHVKLFCDHSISGVTYASGLPARVFPSKPIFEHFTQTLSELNAKLANDHGHRYSLQWDAHNKFSVYALDDNPDGIGKSVRRPCIASFTAPIPAFDWAVDRHANEQLSNSRPLVQREC